ncbi:MAG TPA: hypothetical protein VMV05_12225 [bacterium]|nr:hypothetical protein [bacterium]
MKKRTSSKRFQPKIFTLLVFSIGLLLAAQWVVGLVRQFNSEERLKPYLGQYLYESVSGKVGHKVGEKATLFYRDGQLVARTESDLKEYVLTPDAQEGDFSILRAGFGLRFVREKTGKVVQLISRPNPSGFSFVLRKLDEDNGPR